MWCDGCGGVVFGLWCRFPWVWTGCVSVIGGGCSPAPCVYRGRGVSALTECGVPHAVWCGMVAGVTVSRMPVACRVQQVPCMQQSLWSLAGGCVSWCGRECGSSVCAGCVWVCGGGYVVRYAGGYAVSAGGGWFCPSCVCR